MKKNEAFIILIKRMTIIYNFIKYLYSLYGKVITPIRKRKNFHLFKKYYLNSSNQEIKESIEFMKQNGIAMIPFYFTLKYNKKYEVFSDDPSGYPYALVNTNKIFFPKKNSKEEINKAIQIALMEQDPESPHKYISNNIRVSGHTALLIGGSEGMFALEIVNSFEHIFFFECNKEWISPVSLTLKNYEKKITIVNKFVSESKNGDQINLDDFFRDYSYPIDFMQNDVEGNAISILKGSKQILKKNNVNLAIACYHSNYESTELSEFLSNEGYNCSFSDKFVFAWGQKLQKPYTRKAVLYAKKSIKGLYIQ
jgi:hypothetical protein